jgi:hypothetical protein
MAFWKTLQFNGLRVRLVEYSADYLADHWCKKGHIVHCLEGQVNSEMLGGGEVSLTVGMTYVVSDKMSMHRSYSHKGAKLLIVDGDFLSMTSSAFV